MAGGIKGITVEIGGNVAPLDKALKGVNDTTKNLQSELKEVNKALKFDPDNVTLVKQKQTILKEEIAATTEKLNSLKSAQKQIKDQFKSGTIDEGQYRAFERELEITKSKLSSLKSEKDSVSVVGAAFNEVKSRISEVTSKIQPLITGIKAVGSASATITDAGIKTVGAAVDVAGKGLKAYTGAVVATGTALTGLTVSAATAADDINTMSAQTGLSTDQIQKFQYASELIDVPIDTLTGSMAKLTRNMSSAQDGSGAAADAFSALGVSVKDSNGNLRDNQDVFNDAITALGGIENSTQRDAYAMAIFGKSAQDLNPLILGGADTLEKLGKSADDAGLILSTTALSNLNKYRDSLDILKSNASQSGKIISGVFAGPLADATTQISTALPKLTASVAGLFSGQNMAANQTKLTNDLVSLAQNLIKSVAAQLPTYIAGFNAIIISVVQAIIAVLPTVINSIIPTLIQGFTNLINSLIPLIPVLLPIILNAGIQIFTGLIDSLNQIIPPLMAMLPVLIDNISNTLIQNLPVIIAGGFQLLIGLITGIANCIPELINAVVALIPIMVQALVDNIPALIQAGIQLIVALAQGLPLAIPAIIDALPSIISAIIDGLTSVNWLDVGWQIISGIAKGLWDGITHLDFAGLGNSLLNGLKNVLGIHSPSTLFENVVGNNLALGIGKGFVNTMKSVTKDMAASIPTDFGMSPSLTLGTVKSKYGVTSQQVSPMTYQQTVNNYSPKALSPAETARLTRNATRQMVLAIQG